MDRDEGDVATAIENILGSVAVMIVDVEDRNAGQAAIERGRRDGGRAPISAAVRLASVG